MPNMNTKLIFDHLFEVAKTSRDPEGVVAACLVRSGEILVSSASSDDGQYHAEYLVIQKAKDKDIRIDKDDILYTTLEPCSDLPNVNDGRDCVSCILEAGIKKIVFGANDPEYSKQAEKRLKSQGVNYRQIKNKKLIQKCADLFSSTIKIDLDRMKLPRKDKI